MVQLATSVVTVVEVDDDVELLVLELEDDVVVEVVLLVDVNGEPLLQPSLAPSTSMP